MNANELRIGNKVEFEGNVLTVTYHHIRIQSFADVGQISSITNEKFVGYDPIELTEEWLIKFGFKFQNGYGFSKYNLSGKILRADNERFCFYYNAIIIPLEYVHQLQNLYFALTGEELQLNISNE